MKLIRTFMLVFVCLTVATYSFPVAAASLAPEVHNGQIIYLPVLVNLFHPPINKIAYASGYSNSNPRYDIFVMNADGSGKTKLTSSTSVSYAQPRWSPDGSKIALRGSYPIKNDDFVE
jgi:hypothetical protein